MLQVFVVHRNTVICPLSVVLDLYIAALLPLILPVVPDTEELRKDWSLASILQCVVKRFADVRGILAKAGRIYTSLKGLGTKINLSDVLC